MRKPSGGTNAINKQMHMPIYLFLSATCEWWLALVSMLTRVTISQNCQRTQVFTCLKAKLQLSKLAKLL